MIAMNMARQGISLKLNLNEELRVKKGKLPNH